MAKILIIDDEKNVRDALQIALIMEGYEVRTAGDGNQALKMVRFSNIDLVIADINMPGMNGLQVFSALKKSHPRIPVLLMSGCYLSSDRLIREALSQGARGFISKPCNLDGLKVAIENALS